VPGLAVLALGGVDPATAGACVEAGAAGVAVMGGIMRAADPAAAVRALLRAVAGAAQVRSATT
jgi:thiamine monophosphate synthase